ncbi:hypothetical protein [Nocardioides sp.]|uniref:hypothetical protein n=1 Tax=Nocardioides sp. TaxID=35761 RepID=UPI0031FEDA32|nr:hypothetical protein [Nocardioides sp.]
MNEIELADVFAHATDAVESPDLAASALAGARLRRTRRRGLAAGAAAALAIVAVVVATGVAGSPDAERPPTQTPGPSPSPTVGARQTTWDPREVDDLPAAPADLAPALPEALSPPSSAPPLSAEPIPAAVLSIRGEAAILLLAADGSWRSVPPPEVDSYESWESADLTPDGTRVAVQTRDDGVDVWNLPTGERTHLRPPQAYEPWDSLSWTWVDQTTLLLDDYRGGWLVDAASGAAERVPYPARTLYGWTIDDAGALLESADYDEPAALTDWAGGEPRRIDSSEIGRLETLQADADTVVGKAGNLLFVAARSDLSPEAVLPVQDDEANYTPGLYPVALLGDGTVLFRTLVLGATPTWRLVAWEPESGDLTMVTHGEGIVTSYATDLLGDP